MKQKLFIVLLFFCLSMGLSAMERDVFLAIRSEMVDNFDPIFAVEQYGSAWYIQDSNADGREDYAYYLDSEAQVVQAAYDYNGDGVMDDFILYINGVAVAEIIDTDYDQVLDLWVFLREGIYVESYARDTDGDGRPDSLKSF